jgi:hypothetical protein
MKLYLRMFLKSASLGSDVPIDTTMTEMWLIIVNLVLGIGFAFGAFAVAFAEHNVATGFALLPASIGFVLLSLHVETRARIRSLTHVCTKDCP